MHRYTRCMLVLAALLAAGCGGRATVANDAGPGPRDAALDATGDALSDVCDPYKSPDPYYAGYPYIYYCSRKVSLPDYISRGNWRTTGDAMYYCKTDPLGAP